MQATAKPVTVRHVAHIWWPLAMSWLLMAVELPALSAAIARLPFPEINLAAFAGVVSPIALMIESPIIMLLAASTALCRDRDAYDYIHRFMHRTGAALTVLRCLLAFTPLFDIVMVGIIHPPQDVIEPAHLGLRVMLPWTWSIAYRRFHQGVLIAAGRSRPVGIGTAIRIAAGV